MPDPKAVKIIEALAAHQGGEHRVFCPMGGCEHGALEPALAGQDVVLRCSSCGHTEFNLPAHIDAPRAFNPEAGRAERDIAHQPTPC